jgi:CHAT domain-containing protein/tetratricopeptide (TPR) repeat protein
MAPRIHRALLIVVLGAIGGFGTGISGCRREPPFAPEAAFHDARTKFQQGDLPGAYADADSGLRRLEPTDPALAWRFRVQKAEVLIWQGKRRDALDLLAPAPPSGVTVDVLTRRVLLQGQASTSLQQFDDAERYLAAAAEMADTRAPDVAGDVALSTGTLRLTRRKFDEAETHFQRALQIARTRRQPFLEANARGSLGLVCMRRHQYADAVTWFQSAVAVSKAMQARGSTEKSLGNLGWAYLSMGEMDRALELFTEAEDQARRFGLVNDRQQWLQSLATIQFNRRELDAAEANFTKALAITRQLENKLQMSVNLTGLAAIMVERDKLAEAEAYNAEAIALKRAIGARESELYSLLTQADIPAKRGDVAQAERLLAEVIRDAKDNMQLRAEAQAKLAKLHASAPDQSSASAARTNQDFRDAIVTIERGRDVLGREEFKLPFSTKAKPVYDAYLGFLMSRGDVATACGVADMSRAQTLTQGLGVRTSFSSIEFASADRGCAKPERGVVLSYWVAPKRSYLWVLTPREVKGITLPGEETLADLVTRYRKALAGPLDARQSANAAGIALYKLLVKPAATAMATSLSGDVPRVTIIPDGTLCSLNFETLLVPEPAPHYWIEDVSIASASSLAMLGADQSRAATAATANGRRAPKTLLLIGNPLTTDTSYPPLEHAVTEMTAIGAHFRATEQTQLSGAAATPSAYTRAKPGDYDLIHFVAHGTASRPSPLDSAIVLSEESASHNLYARDIARTPLDARLVTISACDSAGTRTYSGEGLVGLSWAFLRAGAQEVIAALWEVNDASTAQLMDRLYAGIAAGESPADALRAAKLAMLRSDTIYRRPFYWAPFVIYSGSGGRAAVTQSRAPRAGSRSTA